MIAKVTFLLVALLSNVCAFVTPSATSLRQVALQVCP